MADLPERAEIENYLAARLEREVRLLDIIREQAEVLEHLHKSGVPFRFRKAVTAAIHKGRMVLHG